MRAVSRVAVCGAGAMGSGIALIAAQSGATVRLFDLSADALAAARKRTGKSLDGLVAKGRLEAADAAAILARIVCTEDLASLGDSELVIEAIVENAAIKTELFARLEAIVGPDTILASNTSSLPIAGLAKPLARPGRFVGMHFFNPPGAMKLVEIISGPATDAAATEVVTTAAKAWGKVAVPVADVPGFIVNRVARPFYAEAFTALQEQAASAGAIDAAVRAAGFRMGPLELTDFIGQDVNFTVARSVHDAYFGRTRFVPQRAQAALVDAGWYGRKTGRGIYDYSEGAPAPASIDAAPRAVPDGKGRAEAEALLRAAPGELLLVSGASIGMTAGRTATVLAAETGTPTALIDWTLAENDGPILFAASDGAAAEVAIDLAGALGRAAIRIADRPGLIVCRTLAQIANAAADAVFEHVAGEEGIDAAMRFGANYPVGPFAWADLYGRGRVRSALAAIADETGEAMYRPSQYMRSWT
ncbi:MAG: 3-hydroxyacyl-CoA dehydrogenase NAD-binding domain-containing protein [Sphingopyxis sp.]